MADTQVLDITARKLDRTESEIAERAVELYRKQLGTADEASRPGDPEPGCSSCCSF